MMLQWASPSDCSFVNQIKRRNVLAISSAISHYIKWLGSNNIFLRAESLYRALKNCTNSTKSIIIQLGGLRYHNNIVRNEITINIADFSGVKFDYLGPVAACNILVGLCKYAMMSSRMTKI